MDVQTAKLMIIKTGATQLFVVQAKAQGLNKMQDRASVGCKPYDIAAVGRDLRLIEYKMTQRLRHE